MHLARLRRRLTAKQVAERAGMAPMTLRSLERGGSGVTIGAYLAVMQVLGIEKDLALLGEVDSLGSEFQDARLPAHREASKAFRPASAPTRRSVKPLATTKKQSESIGKSPFVSSKKLALLIHRRAPRPKKRH